MVLIPGGSPALVAAASVFALVEPRKGRQLWSVRQHDAYIDMKTIKSIVEGDLVVSEDICLTGVVTGGITVTATGRFELRGVCRKNLVIEQGGRAKIYGVVSGDVSNLGGELSIFSVIRGRIATDTGHTEKFGVVAARQ